MLGSGCNILNLSYNLYLFTILSPMGYLKEVAYLDIDYKSNADLPQSSPIYNL